MTVRLLLFFILAWPSLSAMAEKLPIGVIAQDGRPAPALLLKNMDGKVTDLKDQRGHWVMVHFWASWCGPCRREMPKIQTMSKQLVPKTLRLILVNVAENDEKVFDFLPFVAPDLPTLMDYSGQTAAKWDPRGLPSSFLVDPQGRIRYLAIGNRDWDTPEYIRFLKQISRKRP
jgi:cytochrome c biogenesis protein CcmG/thiol:disulfide interchange protein DsbE